MSIQLGGILSGLPLLAQERGLFAANGIAGTVTIAGDGRTAMENFLAGKCDLAVAGEPPIVNASLKNNDFVVIASLVTSDNASKVLALKERGIRTPADLRGKRLGVRDGTIGHYFLTLFLAKHHLRVTDVQVRFMPLTEMPAALARGDVDAYVGSDVAVLQGRQQFGAQAVVFEAPGLCYNTSSLVVRRQFAAQRPAVVRSVLQALLQAEVLARQEPAELNRVMAAGYRLSPEIMSEILKEQRHAVVLEQTLFQTLESQARWLIDSRAIKLEREPNYLSLLDGSFLKALNPRAVTLLN